MKTIFSLFFLLSLVGVASVQAQEAEAPTAATVPVEEWNGSVDEFGFIPELGHYAAYNEGYLNFRVWNNRIRLYFMDKDRRVIESPVDLATARLTIRGDRNQFIRMQPQGKYLGSPQFLRPPFLFRVNLVVRDGGESEEEPNSAFSFMFRQDRITPGEEPES